DFRCTLWSRSSPSFSMPPFSSSSRASSRSSSPVNSIMTWICATILFVVGSVYSLVTVLPLWCMDCPLMRTVWRFWPQRNSQENNTAQPPSLRDETMVEATFRAAVKRSAQRSAQDSRAIVWTIKSLADDDELEPFVEAIPDLLWGPSGRRYAYLDHVRNLARHPDVRCGTGLLPLGVSQRRRITCYRAIWAVASLATFPQPSEASEPAADIGSKFSRYLHEQSAPSMTSESAPCFASARTMSIWSLYCTVKDRLPGLRSYLTSLHIIREAGLGLTPLWGSTISELQQMSRELDLLLPYRLVFQYLRQSASLTHAPYRWEETWTAISVDPSVPFIDLQHPLEFALDSVISAQLGRINAASDVANVDWIYKNISALLAFWRPEHSSAIPGAVVGFLNGTTSEVVLREILRIGEIEIHLWSNFPRTLSEGPSNPPFLFREGSLPTDPVTAFRDRKNAMLPSLAHSIVALIQMQILDELSVPRDATVEEAFSVFSHRLLPEDTAIEDRFDSKSSDEPLSDAHWNHLYDALVGRKTEAGIVVLAQFLEHCSTAELPYNAVKTLHKMNSNIIPFARIHRSHQIRLASAIAGVFDAMRSPELLAAIIGCDVKTSLDPAWVPWLDDLIAAHKIKATLRRYEGILSAVVAEEDYASDNPADVEYRRKLDSTPNSRHVLTRVRSILDGLDHWHSELFPLTTL
ncbi:hypothetical protein B0H14DRAFT_2864463, partial [Mycena olivaceomarginata]